jgi:hypothetical protein
MITEQQYFNAIKEDLTNNIDKEIISDLRKAAFDPFFFDTMFEEKKCEGSCESCTCEKK